MLNQVTLMGNIGRSTHISLTQEGKEFAKFSLATTFTWKDKEGEWQSATDWHQIAVFRESTVGWIKDVLKRGDKVYVEGRLVYQLWRDRYRQPRKTTYVVISELGGKIEHIRTSQSKAQDNLLEAQTDREEASETPSLTKEESDSSFDRPDHNGLPSQSPEDKGEESHEI